MTLLRALRCEFEVNRAYMAQVLVLGVLVCVILSVSSQAYSMLPGVFCLMAFFSLTVTLGNQDEANGWGAYRLALPLSRRAVVAARYLFVVLAGLAGMVVGALLSAVELGVADEAVSAEDVAVLRLLTPFLFLAGAGLLSVTMPVFFRYGATRATQYLPFVMILAGLAPFFALSLFRDSLAGALAAFDAWVALPGSLALASAVLAALALVLLAASALLSMRLYARRDL